MVEQQRDNNPAIQDFVSWEHSPKTLCRGYGGLDGEARPQYIPISNLRAFFEKPKRTKGLLKALFDPNDPPDEATVQSQYVLAFATLLSINQGHMISYFVEHNSLDDKHMPFYSKPAHFPESGRCDLWTLFSERQWKYCPAELNYNMNKSFIRNEILPFHIECQLDSGGSAHIFKIRVDQGYNHLDSPAGATLPSEFFVLKKYRGRQEAERLYNIERTAYQKLNREAATSRTIIRYHGAFIWNDTYNIILEYADLGTLKDFMQRTDPPATGEEIIALWEPLLKLNEGLHVIHHSSGSDGAQLMLGWHQDIKPENILMKSREVASSYNCDIVLADLGTSHFKQSTADQQDTSDQDTHGTYSYGAPEAHRMSENFSNLPLEVKRSVDIWSLGCVFSEVATWIGHGKSKVEEYRAQREKEVERKLGAGHGDLFHDGRGPLDVVIEIHRSIKLNGRTRDFITTKVLDGLVTDMLQQEKYRPTAMQLSGKAERLIKEAREELNMHRNGRTTAGYHVQALKQLPIEPLSEPLDFNPQPRQISEIRHSQQSDDQVDNLQMQMSSNNSNSNNDIHDQMTPVTKTNGVATTIERVEEREHPRLSVEVALTCRRQKKSRINASLPDEHLLGDLRDRDHVFVIDNAVSMNAHWSTARKVLEALAFMVKTYDPDGIDMVFSKSPQEVKRSKKTEALLKVFDRVVFHGTSNMSDTLSRILEEYKLQMANQHRDMSLIELIRGRRPLRRLSLYVLTDGIWQPRCEVDSVIASMVDNLKANNRLSKQVGIQFIHFGNNEEAKRRLTRLDSGLNLGLDIVDTTPAEGNVWKMLLGSVNNWFDDDDTPENQHTSSPPQTVSLLPSPPITGGTHH